MRKASIKEYEKKGRREEVNNCEKKREETINRQFNNSTRASSVDRIKDINDMMYRYIDIGMCMCVKR